MLEIAAAGIERLKQLQIELLHMKFGGQNR